MSREHDQSDVDQVHQIESGIAESLSRGETAEVDKGTIENGYGLLDASESEVVGSLHEKCAAIVEAIKDQYSVDAEYSVVDGTIRFFPVRPR